MEQPPSGILLLDKPEGITSQQALTRVRKACSLSKIGHAGTLDPLATGLLVVLVGKATKLQEFVLHDTKEYTGTILLGKRTTTDDITGDVLPASGAVPNAGELASVCVQLREQFLGEQQQLPPNFSAVHVSGNRAYSLARKGISLEGKIAPRKIAIHTFTLSVRHDSRLDFSVSCSKGTYIRSLARDIGEAIGCGACIESLRRVRSGGFRIQDSVKLEWLLEHPEQLPTRMLPPQVALESMGQITLSDSEVSRVRMGQQEPLQRLPNPEGNRLAGLFSESGHFIGVVEASAELVWKLRVNYS